MSGRKHHYLPQLIQRPFAYRQQQKEFYVHAHHRKHGRFSPNTSGLGKELDFYGTPEDTSLDDAITRLEGPLADILQAINRDEQVSPNAMATLVSALAFRTKAMRDAMVSMMPPLLAALQTELLEGRNLHNHLIASLSDPRERRKLIYKTLDEGPALSRELRAKAYMTLLPAWKEYVDKNGNELVEQARYMTTNLLAQLRARADEIAQSAYLKSLAADPIMPIRAKRFADELEFRVIHAPQDEPFILGDCGPVAMFNDGRARLVLGSTSDLITIEALFLPVSPERCIFARNPSSTLSMGVSDINELSARLSIDFFISRDEGGDHLDALRMLIGSLSPIDSEDEIVRSVLSSQ